MTTAQASLFLFPNQSAPLATAIAADAIKADFIPPGGAIHADVSPRAKMPLMVWRLVTAPRISSKRRYGILARRAAETRAAGEAMIREADDLLCQSWNERMWADGEPVDPSPTVD
jgi:hypothetical protein